MLLIAGCGGSGGVDVGVDPTVLQRVDVREREALRPFLRDSPYAEFLKECALIESAEDGCKLRRLPFIGQSGNTVTHNDVMNRLLVTHDWMGQRFSTLLQQAPADVLELFASVTVVSIGSTVRPSNYWTGTGGIQLDPRHLWLTLEEKANVSIEEDYRSGYGKELNFWSLQAARIGGEEAYPQYSLTSFTERSLKDIEFRVYSLLYHELGHAVDYVHPDLMPMVDTTLNTSDAIARLSQNRSSSLLINEWPLTSTQMSGLARVQFQGLRATEQQIKYTPTDVGSFMAIDGAIKYYSYHTEREDFANLFEFTMMKKNFGMDLLIGYVTKPANEDFVQCSDLILGWGQHNRISDPLVLPRAQWVVDRVYGSTQENDVFFNSLVGLKRDMTVGLDWCVNRDSVITAKTRQTGMSTRHSVSLETNTQLQFERYDGHH